jgi:hypothetical protein
LFCFVFWQCCNFPNFLQKIQSSSCCLVLHIKAAICAKRLRDDTRWACGELSCFRPYKTSRGGGSQCGNRRGKEGGAGHPQRLGMLRTFLDSHVATESCRPRAGAGALSSPLSGLSLPPIFQRVPGLDGQRPGQLLLLIPLVPRLRVASGELRAKPPPPRGIWHLAAIREREEASSRGWGAQTARRRSPHPQRGKGNRRPHICQEERPLPSPSAKQTNRAALRQTRQRSLCQPGRRQHRQLVALGGTQKAAAQPLPQFPSFKEHLGLSCRVHAGLYPGYDMTWYPGQAQGPLPKRSLKALRKELGQPRG